MSLKERVATKVFDIAEEQGWIDRLVSALTGGSNRFLVLGSSGVGKSNLLESLTTQTPEIIDHMNRTEFAIKHKIKIDKKSFEFIDTPGQDHHKSRRVKALREQMSKGIAGIINVVAYGYHETREGKDEALTSAKKVRPSYLEEFREAEIIRLSEWTPILGYPEIGKVLITVVTKADLWWDSKDEIFNHYQSGKYFEALGEAQSLNPIVVHHCSVFHKFYGEGKLSGTFDASDQQTARVGLLSSLVSAICERGKSA